MRVRESIAARAVEARHPSDAAEIANIRRDARKSRGTIVMFGSFILFSTETGDAWLLDPSDKLAARLASDRDPDDLNFMEDSTTCGVDWPGNYWRRVLLCRRNTGRVVTILGYPVAKIVE